MVFSNTPEPRLQPPAAPSFKARTNGRRHASIIPVDFILRSVHLFPFFGPQAPRTWNTFNVLEVCNTFYVNPFSDRDNYLVLS